MQDPPYESSDSSFSETVLFTFPGVCYNNKKKKKNHTQKSKTKGIIKTAQSSLSNFTKAFPLFYNRPDMLKMEEEI